MVSVQSTERVEAIYPLLKDVTLSPFMPGESNAVKHMFTFSLRSARRGIVTGNPVLAEEATSIAIWCCVTESVDCFEHWDILYRENLEASVALLKRLLGQRRVFLRLSTSPSDSLTVNQTMESFRRKVIHLLSLLFLLIVSCVFHLWPHSPAHFLCL